MSDELKPCPMCGGRDVHEIGAMLVEGWLNNMGMTEYRTGCLTCGCTMRTSISQAEANQRWNTRQAKQIPPATMERMEIYANPNCDPSGIEAGILEQRNIATIKTLRECGYNV